VVAVAPLTDGDMSGPPRREFSKAPNFNILFVLPVYGFCSCLQANLGDYF
jgi:hypothetical protein